MKFATKLYDITHLTLGMLLHYLGKLKIQIFLQQCKNFENRLGFHKVAEILKVNFFETQCR